MSRLSAELSAIDTVAALLISVAAWLAMIFLMASWLCGVHVAGFADQSTWVKLGILAAFWAAAEAGHSRRHRHLAEFGHGSRLRRAVDQSDPEPTI